MTDKNKSQSSNNVVTGIVDTGEQSMDATNQHLFIILSNSHGNTSDNENYNCDILLQFCTRFGFKNDFLLNRKAAGDNELNNLMKRYNGTSFLSRWLIFIGSAIEYGPVGADERAFRVRQIFNLWNEVTEPKVLIVFGSPNEKTPNADITDDTTDTEGIHTFQQLLSSDHEEKVKAMIDLHGTFKVQTLSALNSSVSYFFSSVPISIINDKRESILNIFVNHLESASLEHKSLNDTFKSICSDFKQKLLLPDSLLPVCQVTRDFNI
jgi:hypothetical protein